MEKYINQIVAIDTILSNPPDAHYPVWFAEQIANLRAADVVEVVHGEWIRPTIIDGRTFDIPHCSACGDVPCDTKNYCPNCGAKMKNKGE